jgi:hypothetical protein
LPSHAKGATVRVEANPDGFSHGIYTAGEREANRLTVTFAGDKGSFTVSDPGATIVAGEHCESIDAHTANCVGPPPTFPAPPPGPNAFHVVARMTVTLGDLPDRFTSSDYVTHHVSADGGPGDDVLVGRGSTDHLDGGEGRDRLFGGESDDRLIDGDRGGARHDDHLDGGDSHGDFVSYAHRARGVSVDLRRGTSGRRGERDSLAGIEGVVGGAGNDRIRGTDAQDTIYGLAGDDTIVVFGGHDVVEAGDGDDAVDGGNGADSIYGDSGVDRASCGGGPDRVFGTVKSERVGRLCETVGVDPELQMRAHPLRVSRGAAWFEARCANADGFDPCSATFKLHTAKGRRRSLAAGTFAVSGRRTVRLELTPLGRRLIRRPRGVLAEVSYRAEAERHTGWIPELGWAIRLSR